MQQVAISLGSSMQTHLSYGARDGLRFEPWICSPDCCRISAQISQLCIRSLLLLVRNLWASGKATHSLHGQESSTQVSAFRMRALAVHDTTRHACNIALQQQTFVVINQIDQASKTQGMTTVCCLLASVYILQLSLKIRQQCMHQANTMPHI